MDDPRKTLRTVQFLSFFIQLIPYQSPFCRSVLELTFLFTRRHYIIYSEHKRLLKNSSISTLMATLQNAQVYKGLSKEEHTVSFRKDPSPSCGASTVMRHTVQRQVSESFMRKRTNYVRLVCISDLNIVNSPKGERPLVKRIGRLP